MAYSDYQEHIAAEVRTFGRLAARPPLVDLPTFEDGLRALRAMAQERIAECDRLTAQTDAMHKARLAWMNVLKGAAC